MKFAKVFDNKRYGQIVVMKEHGQDGEPMMKFYCQPEGFGICSFCIGWGEGQNADKKLDEAFDTIVAREAIEIVDGWMKHMQAAADAQESVKH